MIQQTYLQSRRIRIIEQAYLKTYQLGKKEEDWLAVSAAPETVRENQNTEVLFLEQDYKYLCPSGFLAIVIPDGILTNSSLQYVRNQLEDWFRIVAVVSMPQTAFSANGAGVKSSVLFLQKWPEGFTVRFQDKKKEIQERLLKENKYLEQCHGLEKEKKDAQKRKIDELKERMQLCATKVKKLEEYKEWNTKLSETYSDRLNKLKESLQDQYQQEKQKQMLEYPIFMAIAEDIGYDATGKKTAVNELDMIGEELKKFIATL